MVFEPNGQFRTARRPVSLQLQNQKHCHWRVAHSAHANHYMCMRIINICRAILIYIYYRKPIYVLADTICRA